LLIERTEKLKINAFINYFQTMNKAEKVLDIINILETEFPDPPIPLDHTDDYSLLIAVLLSAQCTDKRVNTITPLLFAKAATPLEMIKLTVEEIKAIIRPCGLSPRKSQAIYDLSHILIDKHNGKVPQSFEALEELPGVGHKTASVVMAQAFKVPAFPVDTHIHRLMYRWGLTNGKNVDQTEKDGKRLFPKEIWNDVHLQIIFFGRKYCPARGHKVQECPICSKYGRKGI
jgi:endonuclease III|tara:strand:+ start:878 stop:1567 length:690 start_codon:yes stop_codon:yes gene_type:complete